MRDQPPKFNMGRGEAQRIAEHSEHAWRLTVSVQKMNKHKGRHTVWQERYHLVKDRQGLRDFYQARRDVAGENLANSTIKGRCAAMRCYIFIAMEGHGVTPWRPWDGHTPDPVGEQIMIDLSWPSNSISLTLACVCGGRHCNLHRCYFELCHERDDTDLFDRFVMVHSCRAVL